MRLHRYFGSHADTTLKEKRLLLAKPSDFNDPFEFTQLLSCGVTVEEAEKDLKLWPEDEINNLLSSFRSFMPGGDLKETTPRRRFAELFTRMGREILMYPDVSQGVADKYLRVCCFSMAEVDPDSEILLWSHYSDKHKGVRIEFEIDAEILPLSVVNYSPHRHVFEIPKAPDKNYLRDAFSQMFITKARAWNYEGEVRMIFQRDLKIEEEPDEDATYYLDFNPEWVKTVDFGIKCGKEMINTVTSTLRQDYPHVKTRKAFHHPEDYAIEYRPI